MDRMERLQCVNDTLRTLRNDNTLLGEMCLRIQEYVSEERFLPSELQDNLLRLVQDMREGQNRCRAGYRAVVGSADLPDTYAEAERRLKKQHELFCKEDIVQSAVIFKRLVTDNPNEADALRKAQEKTVIVSPANMTMERCRERYKPYMDFLDALRENNAGTRIGYVRELEKYFAPELIAGAVITRDIYDPKENEESYDDDLDDYDEGIEESVAAPSYLSEENSDEDAYFLSGSRLETEDTETVQDAEDVTLIKEPASPSDEEASGEREEGEAFVSGEIGNADREVPETGDADEEVPETGDVDGVVPETEDADVEISETEDVVTGIEIMGDAQTDSDAEDFEEETAENSYAEDAISVEQDSEAASEEAEQIDVSGEYVTQGEPETLPGFRENAVSEVTAEDVKESVSKLVMSDEVTGALVSDAADSPENVKASLNWSSGQEKTDEAVTTESDKYEEQEVAETDGAETADSSGSGEPEAFDYLADFDENYIEYYLQVTDEEEPMSVMHLPTWPGQSEAFKIEGVKDVLTELGFRIDTLEELDRIRGKYENYNVVLEQMNSQPSREDDAFAGFRREACMTGFRIVCLYGAFSGEELSRAFREIGNRYHTLILFQNPVTQGIRRSLVKLVRRPGLQKEFAVLDKVAYRYLDNNYKPDTINDMFLDIVMPGPEKR